MKKKYVIDYKRGFYFMLIQSLLLVLTMLGGTLNFLAIKSNGGRMPFQANYDYSSQTHFSFQEFTNVSYPFLTDIIKFLNGYWSIGDLVMIIGVLLLFLNAFIIRTNKWGFIKKKDD